MSAGPLVVEIIFTCCLSAFLLHRYGNIRKQHVLVTLATFVAWYFSFIIVFVLPLDVSSTFYRQCVKDHAPPPTPYIPEGNSSASDNNSSIKAVSTESPVKFGQELHMSLSACQIPVSHVPDHVLPALWHVVYWTSQVLTWLLLPIMQSYSTAGDFSVAGKIKTAVISNLIYYASYLLIFGVCLIYVAIRPDISVDGEKLKIIGVTASNTWGLFLLVLLLGFGLVEVPRTIWNNSKIIVTLSRTHFKIAKLSTEKTEADENLEDVLEEIKQTSEKIKYNHPLRQHMETVLLKCPESMRHSVRSNNDDYEDFNKPLDTLSESSLVKLHKRVIQASQAHHRTHAQWNALLDKAFLLEDIVGNEGRQDRTFKHTVSKSVTGVWRNLYTPTAEWYWLCMLKPWFMKAIAAGLTLFSFMVVWSECLFFVKSPVLSLFAVFINLAKQNYDYVYIELASIITIAYLCFCAYYSVFQIRILNFYYIAPHHQTDEYSLMFTGMMLCRLTPPLCLNFLGLIHLDSHITYQDNLLETSYTAIMGHMDVISFVSSGFNIYFPIAIVLLCICTYFSLGNRILHFLGFQQFIGDDDITQELVDEGRELVKIERRRLERKADSEARKKAWNERFGTGPDGASYTIGAEREPSRTRVQEPNQNNQDSEVKQSVARSPDENDKTELLKLVEPVDYTSELHRVDSFTRIDDNSYEQPYQSDRFSQPNRFSSTHRSVNRPPRGIFDDV